MKLAVVALIVLQLVARSITAELIFQPPNSDYATQWQDGGSLLFGGIARIYDAFAALEQKHDSDGSKHLQTALADLEKAARVYATLAGSVKKGEAISLDQVPDAVKTRIQNELRRYDIKVPTSERDAALVAQRESQRLSSSLANLRSRIEKKDVDAIQALLSDLTRAQVIGTDIALVMRIPISPSPY